MASIELRRRKGPLFFFFGGAALIVLLSLLPLLSADLSAKMSSSRNLWMSLLGDYWFVFLVLGLVCFALSLWWAVRTPRTIVIDGRRIRVDGQEYPISHAQIVQKKRAIMISGLGDRRFAIAPPLYGEAGYEAARKALLP